MRISTVRRNILLYKIFTMFSEPLFWGPILIVSLNRLGKMTLSDIYFCESATMLLCVIANIPAGAIADTIGRKKALIIGRVFLFCSTCFFATMTSPFGAWTGNILWAIGFSFVSGADQALLYNTLAKAGLSKFFTKVEGSAVGLRLFAIGVCSLFVGRLAEYDLRLPLLLCIPFSIIPLVLSFFLKEERANDGKMEHQRTGILSDGVLFAIRKKEILWIIFFCSLIVGASKIWFFTYNPYFEKVEIPIRYFGYIFSVMNIVAWLSSTYAHKLVAMAGERMSILLIVSIIGISIIIMGSFPWWPLVGLIVFQNVVRGFMGPFTGNFMNRHITEERLRATALSVRSTLSDMVTVCSLFWFGMMDKKIGFLHSLTILGIAVLVFGVYLFRRYTILFPEESVS